MPYPESPYHPGPLPRRPPTDIIDRLRFDLARTDEMNTLLFETGAEIERLRIRVVGLRAERDDWMDKALAHEQVAAQLRIKLLEQPSPCAADPTDDTVRLADRVEALTATVEFQAKHLLTDEERAAIEQAVKWYDNMRAASTLRALLERLK